METRYIMQYHVYGLILNPMRGSFEEQRLVALAGSKEALLQWHDAYLVEPYYDEESDIPDTYGNFHKWYKCFAKGSPLEWFNPIQDNGRIIDEWLTLEGFRRAASNVPVVDGSVVP